MDTVWILYGYCMGMVCYLSIAFFFNMCFFLLFLLPFPLFVGLAGSAGWLAGWLAGRQVE